MNETLQKIKNVAPAVKGKATIEIFENGELVNRVSKENYINTTMRNAAARMVAEGLIVQNNFSLYGKDNENYYVAPNALSLYNSDLPPSPNANEIPLGDLCGYGRLGETTPTQKRGTFIPVESIVEKTNYRKMVFDFPTSSSNGVFNSIFTFQGYQSDDGSAANTSLNNHKQRYLRMIGQEFPQVYATDDIYVYVLLKQDRATDTQTKKMIRFTKNNFAKAIYLEDATGLYDLINLPQNVTTLAYLDGYFYFTDLNGKLYRSTKNNPGSITLVKTFNTPELYNAKYISVGADPVSKKLYILVAYTTTPPEGNLYVIDKTNFSVLDRMYLRNLADDCYFLQFDPRGRYLAVAGYIYDTQLKKMVELNSGDFISRDGAFGMPVTFDGYLSMSTAGAFSRFVLDSPVTKTSTQTMKITYEFTLEQDPITADPIT